MSTMELSNFPISQPRLTGGAKIMPGTGGSTDLPFIITTNRKRIDPETRKLIRSHVMRGKNRDKSRVKLRDDSNRRKPDTESLMRAELTRTPNISRALSSRFSGIRFADTVELALIEDAFSFATIFPMAMFLLHPCIVSEHEEATRSWFTPMLFDAAYLHATCFTIQAYFDAFFARTPTVEAQQRDRIYYAKCIRMLRERLARDDDLRLSDSTIMTVLALSGHAYTTGDYESVDNHSNGVLKMVSMRGIDSLFHNTRLLIEVVRCDLVMAIDKVSKPVLFTYDTTPWPLTTTEHHSLAHENTSSTIPQLEKNHPTCVLDPLLATIWTATSTFCTKINTSATFTTSATQPKITETIFLHSMVSIMYRLTTLHFETGSINEVFRFALLAFTSPLFLHWNRIELPDPRFNVAFRERLMSVDWDGGGVSLRERLWLLMVAALSMDYEPDGLIWLLPLLRDYVERCGVNTWTEMRDLLDSCLWVGWVYDKQGREIYDIITT